MVVNGSYRFAMGDNGLFLQKSQSCGTGKAASASAASRMLSL